METSSLPSEQGNTHNLGNVKGRIHCLIGSILVVLLIWLIWSYFYAMLSATIHGGQIFLRFFQHICDRVKRMPKLTQQIICLISGIAFIYCFCCLFRGRKLFILEKAALTISPILLFIAFMYKFSNPGTKLYDVSLPMLFFILLISVWLILLYLLYKFEKI